MIEFLKSIPMWFIMIIIAVFAVAVLYKFLKSDKVKIGPVEFDEEENGAKNE